MRDWFRTLEFDSIFPIVSSKDTRFYMGYLVLYIWGRWYYTLLYQKIKKIYISFPDFRLFSKLSTTVLLGFKVRCHFWKYFCTTNKLTYNVLSISSNINDCTTNTISSTYIHFLDTASTITTVFMLKNLGIRMIP